MTLTQQQINNLTADQLTSLKNKIHEKEKEEKIKDQKSKLKHFFDQEYLNEDSFRLELNDAQEIRLLINNGSSKVKIGKNLCVIPKKTIIEFFKQWCES